MNLKRNVYLEMQSVEKAREILFEVFCNTVTDIETIESADAIDRVLASPAVAAISSPNFHSAAMDGIAVDAALTFGASEDSVKTLIPDQNAFWVNTGYPMPAETNAVIIIEHLNILNDNSVEIEAPVFPWQNVRKMGEDIVTTQLLFSRGHKINAYDTGALISGGVFRVQVHKKPKILIIPTGSELRQWQDTKLNELKAGDILESNSTVLAGLSRVYGADPVIHPMLKDNIDPIRNVVEQASNQKKFDMICIIGGSSAGSEDYAKSVISSLGEIYVHGVTMMPGKPLIFGNVNKIPVFGIPGYPISAIIAFEQFAGPLLAHMQKLPPLEIRKAHVFPARKIPSKLGQEEFLRVKIGSVDGKLISSQLPRGAGSITSITEADGIIRIPSNVEGIQKQEKTEAQLLRPLSSIENTVIITGSHDNTLDIMADQIRKIDTQTSISSNHVGSMGGLIAIKNKTCHMAGIHLLDTLDGSYNISYIKKYLPDEKVRLINLVMRTQGLIVPKGNPKQIESLEDLVAKNLKFINRQPGSGTRILLDYKLKSLGIEGANIPGYEDDEYTHMSVAMAVLSGRADTSLGIMAAANALDLDFIPVITEEYDLIIPEKFFEYPMIQLLLNTINSQAFKERVTSLGGYGVEKTGKLIYKT